MLAITVFFQMLSFVVMIGAGAGAAKANLLDETANQRISALILTLFSPMLMVASAASTAGNISLKSFGLTSLTAVGMFLFYIAVSAATAPLYDRDKGQQKLYQLMFVFSNLGFIGIPVVSNVLGPEYVIYVTEFMLMYNFVFYTYGIVVMEGKFSFKVLKEMLNSGTVFWLISILLILFRIPLPDFIKSAVSYLGNVTTPLALMGVGYTMVHMDRKQLFGDVRLYVFTFFKMLLLPLIMLRFLRLFPVSDEFAAVCLILFGMPNGNMPLVMGTQRGMDCKTCTAAIVLTTLLSVVTIPVLLAVSGVLSMPG